MSPPACAWAREAQQGPRWCGPFPVVVPCRRSRQAKRWPLASDGGALHLSPLDRRSTADVGAFGPGWLLRKCRGPWLAVQLQCRALLAPAFQPHLRGHPCARTASSNRRASLHNGAYWQASGVKKQAQVACHPSYRRAPLGECFEAETSRISAWREGALGAPPDSDAPSPPVPFFLALPEGAGGTPGSRLAESHPCAP